VGTDTLIIAGFLELNFLRGLNLEFNSLVDLVIIFLLVMGLLVIMVTPLFLLYCWVSFSIDYVRKYRSKFSVKKWFAGRSQLGPRDVTNIEWLRYRSTYSRMVGFGFSIIAYLSSSVAYLIQSFESIEHGIVEYFSFPFHVMRNLGRFQSMDRLDTIDRILFPYEEAWAEMIFIVVISAIFFLVGYIFAAFLVDYRLSKLKRNIRQTTKIISKKKMFTIDGGRPAD